MDDFLTTLTLSEGTQRAAKGLKARAVGTRERARERSSLNIWGYFWGYKQILDLLDSSIAALKPNVQVHP